MKKLFIILQVCAVLFLMLPSCKKETYCYVCITAHSTVVDEFHYLLLSMDTVNLCGMTPKDANAYESNHTYHSKTPGDMVTATSCHIPAE